MLDARKRECLIALCENEIKEWQEIIAELKSGDESVPSKLLRGGQLRTTEVVASPDKPSRVRVPRAKKPRKVREPKTSAKKPGDKTYTVSQAQVVWILEKAGEPLTTFKIKELLLKRYNTAPSEKLLAQVLTLAKEREVICSPQQGEYALPN